MVDVSENLPPAAIQLVEETSIAPAIAWLDLALDYLQSLTI